jgi:peptidoglycan/xylan/chitin deacetylase (PgdA/CDA1 family)
LVRARGYKIVGWHIDSCDWAFEKTGSVDIKEAISCGVLPQYRNDYVGHVVSAARARNGGIILMHEIHPNTIKKLEEIITQLRADGFVFGTILDEDFQQSLR